MRAIAAMLVVVDHAINSNDFRMDLPRSWLGSGLFNEFGASGVDLFFVLSGFVMAHAISNPSASSASRFMINRLIRIVPFYWAASLLFLAVTTVTGRSYDAAALFNNLTIFPLYDPTKFVPPALIVGWTLTFELAFYSIVSFSIWSTPNPAGRIRVVAQAVAVLAIGGIILEPRTDLLAIWANPMWFEFLLGIFIHWLWRRPKSAVPKSACLLIGLVGLAGLSLSLTIGFPFEAAHWGILDGNAGLARPVWWALPYSLILLSLLWLSETSLNVTQSRPWRFLLAAGDASFSLYLIHLTVIFAWEDLAPTNSINADLVIALLLAVNVALALACYRLVEEPMLKSLRRKILGRRRISTVPAPALAD